MRPVGSWDFLLGRNGKNEENYVDANTKTHYIYTSFFSSATKL